MFFTAGMGQRSELYLRWKEADAAVRAILNGAQSATVSAGGGSKSWTRASLSELRKERSDLAAQIARIDRGGRPAITRVRIETKGAY